MAKIYNAPKPRFSDWVWFKFIAIRAIFPLILLWDLVKLGVNKLLGKWVGSLVLPAQNQVFHCDAVRDDTVSNYNEDDLVCEKHKIITHDNAHLDTFEVKHKSQAHIEPKHQKYIINLCGNCARYECRIDDIKEDAKTLKANVVGFNFRGVGQSTGKAQSKEDLVIDGIAQVQRLLDQGVSPQNITLKGYSLGAAVATLVAQHFHQLGQPINLFNDRSFSNITSFLVGHIRLARDEYDRAIGHKDSLGGIILGWLAYPFVKFVIALAKWEINAGSAFKSIPEAYRDYIVVRSRKGKRDKRIDDATIPHYASIHKELTSERRKKKAEIDKEIERMDKSALLTEPERAKVRKALIQAREKIKSDRKMETDNDYEDGHQSNLKSLHNQSGKSAQAFFREFVQRRVEDNAVKSAPRLNLPVI